MASEAPCLTSPRWRGEVDRAQRGRVRGPLRESEQVAWRSPLTPTLSPQAGRGRRRCDAISNCPSSRSGRGCARLLIEVFRRRVIACVDRLRQERLLVIGPELADVRVGLDHRVDESAVLALAFADEDVADDIAEMIETNWPARRIGEGNRCSASANALRSSALPSSFSIPASTHWPAMYMPAAVAARQDVVVASEAPRRSACCWAIRNRPNTSGLT